MKFLLAFLLAIVAVYAAEDDVFVLTNDNFDSWIKNQEVALVEFYAPWCGHCKTLAPEYAKAAEALLKENPPIRLAKVDATVESALGARFDVRGYPTLKVFRHGTAAEYKGPRDAPGIISYMLKQSGASAKPLATVDEVKAFINKDRDVSVIGFFPVKNYDAENFLKAADTLREDFRFGYVSDKSVLEGIEGVSEGVVLFHGENQKFTYGGGSPAIGEWIWDKSVPRVGEITKDNTKRYQRKNLPILKVYFDVDWKSNLKQTNYYVNRLKKVAEEQGLKDKLQFAIASKKDFNDEIQKFGLAAADKVGVVIDDYANSLKYKHTGEFSIESVAEFAKNFVDQKLKPYIKSEPVPVNDQPVKVVVGETFNDIVLDPTKDVLIELYAPWCGHCKKLVPIYDELAKSLEGVENLVIAKMDATANDAPHAKYQAKGYPTILLAKANDKSNPVSYSGQREVKDFTSWLKQNTQAAKWGSKKEL